ncbi:uncharacterized protein LOC142328784 isoform X2 [Lycorma delicatula]|uniref:uncharacterized protein LOC142328784 isoform X2 n=1 Tax=Lycorma delicatula TaxID=130591 RepID=UPI003F50FA3B
MATPAVQQFCLRWNNHQPNFISVFSSLLNSESLVDVTLAAEGKHIQAHKIVLSACSTYFQSLFTLNPCKHPIVILKDIKYSDLKTMVDFMYCGEVNVSQEQLPAVLKTAETLKVKGLAEMPEHNISLSSSLDKNSESSPAPSPSMLRRKRLRKSSTGSGSGSTEQTTTGGSEETVGSGAASPNPNSSLKMEPHSEAEGSLRNEPSTESEPGFASQESVDDEPTPTLQQSTSEERNDSGMKSSMEDSGTPSGSSHYSSGDTPGTVTMGSKRGRLLMRQHRIKKESEIIQGYDDDQQLQPQSQQQLQPSSAGGGGGGSSGSGSVSSNVSGSTVTIIPRVIERQCSEPASSQNPQQPSPNLLSVPQPSFLVKQHSSPLLLSTPQPTSPTLHVHLVTPSSSEPVPGSISIRPKEELRRTASSPQCSTTSASELIESRSCHCPVLRPGPALGCNFCWNTIDAHGRILRRKTKYHCPECQTNLCIVPCFQEYHERYISEARVVVPVASGSSNSSSTVVPTIMKTSSM